MEDSSHSPFWPLQLLVVYLGAWIGYHVFALNEERLALEDSIQQTIPQADAALAAKKKLLSLAENINQLAAKDAAAAQIVNEFKIHGQSAPTSEAPPAAEESAP